ncbi:MAG: methyltransferase RsmF C-terminal domain-like protein [Desulfobacteraceae bacterium]
MLLAYLEKRFGIAGTLFRQYLFFKRSKGWRILRASEHLEKGVCRLKVSVVGIPAFHRVGAFIKPSTRFIQIFGVYASRARLELTTEELQRLLSGREIESNLPDEDGYVVLFHQGSPLGLGLLLKGRLRSQLPKDMRTSPRIHQKGLLSNK